MRKIILFSSFLPLLGCTVTSEDMQNGNLIQIDPIIKQVGESKNSVSSSNGSTSFVANDQIGLIYQNVLSQWTFNGTKWSADKAQYWKDKTSDHTFYAFYPYVSNATLATIQMPDLSKQDGDIGQIGTYDFLVGNKTCTYATSGNVSLEFSHINTLVTLIIKKENDNDIVTLNSLKIEGTDILSPSTYSFNNTPAYTVTSTLSTKTFTLQNTSISNDGYQSTYILHPLTSALTVTIGYTKDNNNYTAQGTINTELKAGVWNTFTLRITPEGLTLTGNIVKSWDKQIILEEIPIKEITTPISE